MAWNFNGGGFLDGHAGKRGGAMMVEEFARKLIAGLTRVPFVNGMSYVQYVRAPQEGDEADFVDARVTRLLLEALGYDLADWTYNRTKEGSRPDYLVRVGHCPVFVVEDKNTAEEHLEEHLGQLCRYMRNLGVQRGILTNGKLVLAYEVSSGVPVLLLRLSLPDLVSVWEQRGGIFVGGEMVAEEIALYGLYLRFARVRFTEVEALVGDLIYTDDGRLHDESTWPSRARIPVLSAGTFGFTNRFIDEIRGVLGEIRRDVEAQLEAHLEDCRVFAAGLEELERELELEDRVRHFLEVIGPYAESGGAGTLARVEEALLRYRTAYQARPLAEDPGLRFLSGVGVVVRSWVADLDRRFREYHRRRAALEDRHRRSLLVQEAFKLWRGCFASLLMPGAAEEKLVREFAVQTAYIFFVRLFLVRVAEDKGLLPRMFTNGGLSLWFKRVEPYYLRYSQGQGTDHLLSLVFASASHVYAHFFERGLFDWYLPNRNLLVRLLHRLAHYDFAGIDQDVIGHLYARYVEEEHKHRSGMYYTPPEVVDYILDRVGFSGRVVIGKRLLDPACGSGTFLVRAARRILRAFAEHYGGEIPAESIPEILRTVEEGLYGLDVNPFACYLAEVNLLIQVMDLLRRAAERGIEARIDRFHVYNTDSLRPSEDARLTLEGLFRFTLPPEEAIKTRQGEFVEGFDYVVANPPYVRADESDEVRAYRDLIRKEALSEVRGVLRQKWDLFVPFVALGLRLLRDGGRLGMITSSAVEVAPYAEQLREELARFEVDEVDFFSGVRLFEEVQVSNTIFFVTKQPVAAGHRTLRRWYAGGPGEPPCREEVVLQQEWGSGVFRRSLPQRVPAGSAVPLGEICYVSIGMVLNADERRCRGSFTKDDLISRARDADHPRPYVEGKHIGPYRVEEVWWLEYGEDPERFRAPHLVRRPTFPELWDREKVLVKKVVGERADSQGQAYWDRGPDFLLTNEGIILCIRWCDLAGVENRSIRVAREERRRREALSRGFLYGYLTAVINGRRSSDFLRVQRRSSANIYPDDVKVLPVPRIPLARQEDIAARVDELQNLYEEAYRLVRAGWRVDFAACQVCAPAVPVGRTVPLGVAEARWGLRVRRADVSLRGVERRGPALYKGRVLIAELDGGVPEEALDWLVRQFPGNRCWGELRQDLKVPASPEEAVEELRRLEREERSVEERLVRIGELGSELEALMLDLS